ncbi:2,4-dienoyl-CoA reductase [Roridomyces roridus]|uniref:2,4-dienoyl-CoA reductase [(3E)-enoyl-CoA-producing] n=1 Tax=Roridomyces roridus TaxID=1738132 RepID=A0AAD7BHD5_9AGAR|nr:2,4-dienoyl-CoA reductase [Roridomyces roridus]
MAPSPYVVPFVPSTSVFKEEIFNGKVLFCTGGGSGICRGMTEAILRHGANATIIGRKVDRLTQAAKELSAATGRKVIAAQGDVRQPETLAAAVKKTIEAFGRIDFVICGAAGNFLAPISGLSENGFRTVIEIDTIGTYNTIKATLPHIRAAKGAYIHVSATLHYRGTPYQAHVSAAKAGIDALSAVLAVEEGPHGVRSNVIAPGPIHGTEGMDRLENKGTADERAQWDLLYPSGRMGVIGDVANAAVFLFSDAALNITGQVLPVDGGSVHLGMLVLPYPKAVLDPEGIKSMIKGKL